MIHWLFKALKSPPPVNDDVGDIVRVAATRNRNASQDLLEALLKRIDHERVTKVRG